MNVDVGTYLFLLLGGIVCLGLLWRVYCYLNNDETIKKDNDSDIFSDSDNT